jgi:hypothetical protein
MYRVNRSMWGDFLVLTGIVPAGKPKKIFSNYTRVGYPHHHLYLKSKEEIEEDKKDAELLRKKY